MAKAKAKSLNGQCVRLKSICYFFLIFFSPRLQIFYPNKKNEHFFGLKLLSFVKSPSVIFVNVPFRPLLFAMTAAIASGAATKPDYLKHRLLSEIKSVAPGRTFTVALFLDHDDDFHTYWQTEYSRACDFLAWDLPDGSSRSIQWQVPEK